MKKIICISLFFIVVLGFTGQLQGQNLSVQQKDLIENQVDSVFHAMIKAAENLDYDALSKGVDDRYHAGFIINGAYYFNYDSLIHTYTTQTRVVKRQNITLENKKLTVLSENIVLLTASGHTMVDLTSGNSFGAKFMWSFVYEKINNSWKVIYSHQSGNR
jgi:hypothetical protein